MATAAFSIIMEINEYVAVSIEICPWEDSMQFGIKFKVTPSHKLEIVN